MARPYRLPSSILLIAVVLGGRHCDAKDEAETITCWAGWKAGAHPQTIPKSWVNDGYCDCPFDGSDEPDTNACSGSSLWPGVATSLEIASMATTSELPATETEEFVCPKQPNLVLPLSRLHDGICDCCDGSDEAGTKECPDDCEEVLRAERERLAKITNDYLIGSQKRDTDLLKFATLRQSKMSEAATLEEELEVCNSEMQTISNTKILELKKDYVVSRMTTMKDRVVASPMSQALLEGLDASELEALVVHLCQVAGEIARATDSEAAEDEACVALRVAAMDLGLSWNEQEDFENYETTMKATVNMTGPMVQRIFENAMDGATDGGSSSLRWSSAKRNHKKGRRRLNEAYDDDYMPHMDDDEFGGYDRRWDRDEDEYDRDEPLDDIEDPINDKEPSVTATDGKATDEFLTAIRESTFSKTRSNFLARSEDIMDQIFQRLNAEEEKTATVEPGGDDDSDSKSGDNAEGTESESDSPAESAIDPTAYKNLRSSLARKQTIIRTGLRWGASAKLLFAFSSLRQSKDNLRRLAIGTIFYGQVSAVQVWQILQAVLPEYSALHQSNDDICASPWAAHCPPNHVYRESAEGLSSSISETTYPPSFLLDAAKTFCDEEVLRFGKDGSGASGCRDNQNIDAMATSSSDDESSYGFTIPVPRNQETDPFQTMFGPILSLPVNADGLRSLEAEKKSKEDQQRDLTTSINDIWKEVGGKDGTALGRDGELYSIANDCFDVVAGKYTYEVCLSGKAQQKEGSNKSGTNLGKFKGIEYLDSSNETTSTRVLKWENGDKCWNGPKRSATVYMKCGRDHKLVSADEPDTCRYVFEMESYLACDDAYRLRMGL